MESNSMPYELLNDECILSYVEPLHVSIRAAENGFIVTTSGGRTTAKTYIASTLEHAQSIINAHFNSGV